MKHAVLLFYKLHTKHWTILIDFLQHTLFSITINWRFIQTLTTSQFSPRLYIKANSFPNTRYFSNRHLIIITLPIMSTSKLSTSTIFMRRFVIDATSRTTRVTHKRWKCIVSFSTTIEHHQRHHPREERSVPSMGTQWKGWKFTCELCLISKIGRKPISARGFIVGGKSVTICVVWQWRICFGKGSRW